MDSGVQIALIVAAAPTLIALGSLITSIRNNTKLGEVAGKVDGRMESLLAATKAQGRLEEQAVGKVEIQRQEVRQDVKDAHTSELLAASIPPTKVQ